MTTAQPHPAYTSDLAEVRRGARRPKSAEFATRRLGVVGSGMMGSGIACAAALHNIEVVLLDTTTERAESGRAYTVKVTNRLVERGSLPAQSSETTVGRISTTTDFADLAGCDSVVEAVFEDPDIKATVFRDVAANAPDAFLASNTSTLPIGDLARSVADPTTFVGMHFFSPVDRMELLEIIVGPQSDDAAVAHAFDLGRGLGKTPIIVNDSRGFYTSRTIGKYLDEAMAMVAEGIDARTIERVAVEVGYPVGPLQLIDETSISLARTIRDANRDAAGDDWLPHDSDQVLDRMVVEFDRPGRAGRAGFYDYDRNGRRLALWSGLADNFGRSKSVPDNDVRDRLLFSEAVDTLRCFEEGVLRTPAEANVGSVLGIGYPAATGGTARLASDFDGEGFDAFAARARELESRYGNRFTLPPNASGIVRAWY